MRTLGPYMAFGAAIALFMPDRLARDFAVVLTVPAKLAAWIPAARGLASLSPFPHTVELVVALMCLAFPFAAFAMGRRWTPSPQFAEASRARKLKLAGGAVLLSVALSVMAALFEPSAQVLGEDGRGDLFVYLMTQGRLGLALLAPPLFAVNAAFLGIGIHALGLALREGPLDPAHHDREQK